MPRKSNMADLLKKSPQLTLESRPLLMEKMDITIVGIDPGSRLTGFGVIQCSGDQIKHISNGVIQPQADLDFAGRIAWMADGLAEILKRYSTQVVVLEKIFLGRNPDSAFKLGHARGALMAEAARAGVPVVEYAARQVKKGISGSGAASKEEIQMVIQRLLQINHIQKLDASDALALACFHAFEGRKNRILQRAVEGELS